MQIFPMFAIVVGFFVFVCKTIVDLISCPLIMWVGFIFRAISVIRKNRWVECLSDFFPVNLESYIGKGGGGLWES